jgi:FkbM family methyltransferase
VAAPLYDYVGCLIYYFGDLDRKVSWVCSRVVRRGDVVLDIGANLGLMTFMLSALVGADGFVHAFEPNPEMCHLIDEAMIHNGVKNVVLHRVALGAQDGELMLSVPNGNAGAASLNKARQFQDGKTMAVPVRTLSSVLADQQINHIRLVKLDVEGFEPEVLTGAAGLFARQPPDVILFELNDCSMGELRYHPTIRLLSQFEYGFFRLPKSRLLHMRAFRLNPQETSGGGQGHDFVAARLGSVYDSTAKLLRAV